MVINNKFNTFNEISVNKTKGNNTISKINDCNQKEELDNYELNDLKYNDAII